MFRKIFQKSKPVIKVVERVRVVEVESEASKRTAEYLERSTKEIYRLSAEIETIFGRIESGNARLSDQEDVARLIAQHSTIIASQAILLGKDISVMNFRLDKAAAQHREDRFPVTSFLASGSPIYVD
jgi:septal ring factor EnvC (AmiA/AmiB activator)